MNVKHWTEPNGIFIMRIPINWQYKNAAIKNVENKPPYSFEAYENSAGCFQISCYPLSEKGVIKSQPIQKENSKINWLEAHENNSEFDIFLWYAQVEDQFCMAKCIYSAKDRKKSKVKKLKRNVEKSLDTIRIIPIQDREKAIALDKFDNFLGSLVSSYDLLEKSLQAKSYIESIALISNQIDALLRISIVLTDQLKNQSNEIELKYLFQGTNERGITERKIYSKAKSLDIINEDIFKRLNDLYDIRNRVIHRYIISYLKTVDIAETTLEYLIIAEEVRMIVKSIEDKQIDGKLVFMATDI